MSQKYLTKVDAFILPFLDKNGFQLIKSEFVEEDHNWYLRLYIDLTEEEAARRLAAHEEEKAAQEAEEEISDEETVRELLGEADDRENTIEEEYIPGIGINDCAKVSRYLSKWLDKEDFVKEAYTLEVCSRGFLQD